MGDFGGLGTVGTNPDLTDCWVLAVSAVTDDSNTPGFGQLVWAALGHLLLTK